MTDAELRAWAEAYSVGPMASPVAVAVLVLLDDNDRLRLTLQSAAERIANQSVILSRRAEKKPHEHALDGTHC